MASTVGKSAEVEQSGIYVDRGTCQFDRCYPLKSTHGCETMAPCRMQKHTWRTHHTDGHTSTSTHTSTSNTSNTTINIDATLTRHKPANKQATKF